MCGQPAHERVSAPGALTPRLSLLLLFWALAISLPSPPAGGVGRPLASSSCCSLCLPPSAQTGALGASQPTGKWALPEVRLPFSSGQPGLECCAPSGTTGTVSSVLPRMLPPNLVSSVGFLLLLPPPPVSSPWPVPWSPKQQLPPPN